MIEQRIEKLVNSTSKNTVIIPVDDVAASGPEGGLRRMKHLLTEVAENGANAALGYSGTLQRHRDLLTANNVGTILNLTSSTDGYDHTRKLQIATVEQAQALSFNAVAVHINAESIHKGEMFQILGAVRSELDTMHSDMPLIVFAYPRGERDDGNGNIVDENFFHLIEKNPEEYARLVRHAVAIAAAHGADMIKTPFTGNADTFATVIEAADEVPVVMSGGPKIAAIQTLSNARQAIDAGARGVAIGRNVFNHATPGRMVAALGKIVHEGQSAEEAIDSTGLNPNF